MGPPYSKLHITSLVPFIFLKKSSLVPTSHGRKDTLIRILVPSCAILTPGLGARIDPHFSCRKPMLTVRCIRTGAQSVCSPGIFNIECMLNTWEGCSELKVLGAAVGLFRSYFYNKEKREGRGSGPRAESLMLTDDSEETELSASYKTCCLCQGR